MENWTTVIVPTFYDETKELDQDKLKTLSEKSELDVVTLKNALVGKGMGFILKTPKFEKIEKIVKAFNDAKIPCLPANSLDVDNEIKLVYARELAPVHEGIKITSFDGESYIVKDKLILVSDILSQEVSSVKKAVISAKKITLVTKDKVFVVDFVRTRILTEDGKKGISQKANLIQLLEKIQKENKLLIDSTFYFQSGFFMKDIERLSMFLAYALKYGIYEKELPSFLFKKAKPKPKPVFDHKVIRGPFKTFLYKMKIRMRDNVVYPPVFWMTSMLILIYIGIRAREAIFFWTAFLIGFIVFTFKLFRAWKIKHLIEDTPTSKLRSVAAGFVEVSGKITSPKPVTSPISGSPCVFFRYFKEVYVNAGRHSHWDLVEVGEGYSETCVLRDGTGEIGVNIKNASFFLTNKYTTSTKYLEMRYSLFTDDNVRYTEEYILDGQDVYVLGTAKPVSKSVSYGKFLSELKKDKDKMKDFDLNGDGVIDAEEWERAQKKLRDEYLEYKQLKGQAADLVIDFDKNNGVFVISNEKENNILKRLRIVLPLYFIGSLVCLVLTLWLTIKIF